MQCVQTGNIISIHQANNLAWSSAYKRLRTNPFILIARFPFITKTTHKIGSHANVIYSDGSLVPNVKKDKTTISKKCVWHLLCKLRSLEVDRVWHNGRRWKPRLPCHLSADRALTAIIWKGDKVSALCIVIIAPGADLTLILPDIQITPMLIRTQFMLQKCRLKNLSYVLAQRFDNDDQRVNNS